MTREIALHCMKSYSELHSDLCELCPIYGQTGSDHCFEDALQYVIGILEQEPILDKIKAEIEQTEFILDKTPNLKDDRTDTEKFADWSKMFKMLVINIIDKYKAERSVKE